MPRLNSRGDYAMGTGGIQGSINGELVPDSYGPQWYNLDNAVFLQPSDSTVVLYDIHTKARTPQIVRAANALMAGGNVWALWQDHFGLQASTGWYDEKAGLLDVGPDGAIGYVVDRQQGIGASVRQADGFTWRLTEDVVYDLQLLGFSRAIWHDQHMKIKTYNIPPCIQIGNCWRPRAIMYQSTWWVCYYSDLAGIVLHPFDSTIGYRIVPLGINAHQHDIRLTGSTVQVIWSDRPGEIPSDFREKYVDFLTEAPYELNTPTQIPAINKPCWLGWFEFTNEPSPVAPSNSLLYVKAGGAIHDRSTGQKFAQWVQGNTVEEIEQQVASSPYPCVAYWDARVWPRYPQLRDQDYIGVQAYCLASESPTQFESAMRHYLDNVYNVYSKVALICQCYTSNLALTSSLIPLVGVYARLAEDYANVTMLLVFSDQGRATGLNDHPEVRPYWQVLFEGITGTPMEEPNEEVLPEYIYNTLVAEREKFPTPLGKQGAVLLNRVAWIHRADGWGLEFKAGGNVCEQPQTGETCGCDILRLMDWGYDCLIDAEGDAIPTRGARGPADPNRFRPPVDPGDVPVEGSVVILYYDQLVRRSNPNGMLIRFEVESPNPVLEIDLDLEGDGEPSISIQFLNEPRRDGRYCRALAFKPTVNGRWTLRVTATDDKGNQYQSDGSHIVEVIP